MKKECNFKVTLKGAINDGEKTQLINKDLTGDGVICIVKNDRDENAIDMTCAAMGNFSRYAYAKILGVLEGAWGKNQFAEALMLHMIEQSQANSDEEFDEEDDEEDDDEEISALVEDEIDKALKAVEAEADTHEGE